MGQPLSPPRLRRRRCARSACRLLLAAVALAASGCGEPRSPGGFGDLDRRPHLVPLLVLEGTPHEMGWWHGHLFRSTILEDRAATEALFFGRLGSTGRGESARAQRAALEAHLDLCVNQTVHRLSERMLQELDGMAAATGLEHEALLRLDVMRDALRMKGLDASLEGAAGLAPVEGGFEARAWWRGEQAQLYGPGLLIHRKPTRGVETVCLTWPGSIGAVAAVTADGRGFLMAEVEMHDRRRMGFGGGRPFAIAARESLEEAVDAGDILAASTATMGHLLLAFAPRADAVPPVEAVAAVQAYLGEADPIYGLRGEPFLAVGPYEDGRNPDARSLQESVVRPPDLSAEERFLRLRTHVGAAERPCAIVKWRPGRISLSLLSSGGQQREVVLTAP